MPNHWLGLTPHAFIEDLIRKGKLTTASLGAELHIKIIWTDQQRITILHMPKMHAEGSPIWVMLDYLAQQTNPKYHNTSIGRIVLNAQQTPLRASDSPGSIQFTNLAFDDADWELEIGNQGGHRLNLAILVCGMQHHISPENWPPFDDYKFEPLEYLLTQTLQPGSRAFYERVVNRARYYQNPVFTRSMSPAEMRKLFARMLGIEIAVRNQYFSSRGVVEVAVLLQRRYLDTVPRKSARDWGLYLWPISKQNLRELRTRKTTTFSTPKAAPRIYDVVGWLENDDTSPRVELYQDFVPDDCVFKDYRLDQMTVHWAKWGDVVCNEQGEEPMLDRFWFVNWFGSSL